jgi:CarboxypepD_reg-like domain
MNQIHWRRGLLFVLFLCMNACAFCQGPLSRPVSIDVNRQRLDNVLEIISNKGNFYFSYNSNIINKDSLVSLSVSNKPVKQVLELLLNDHYEFRESGNYVIIRKAPITINLVTNKAVTQDNAYTVSGYVLDNETGNWIRYASIYEKNQLASTLTNDDGYFKLRLKHKTKTAAITVSKEFYEDTTVYIDPGYDQQLTITITPVSTGAITIIGPDDYFAPEQLKIRVQTDSAITEYTYTRTDSVKVEKTGMGRFLLSSQQKVQSLNLKHFFITRPFQLSITPGLGTHGKMSGQVINNFSVNLFGGYNGGVSGFEGGGLFNIDKKYVQGVQFAGLFSIVGGQVNGWQMSGINNTVLGRATGFQVGGVSNIVKGKFTGFQLAGIYNHVSDSVHGLQLGGIANFAKRSVIGSQVSGIGNVTNGVITGAQIGGILNYARHLKGFQVGLINVSDTSEGLSIGLVTIVFKGYHKLSFSTDEVINANAAFKTGSRKLYNILQAGMNFNDTAEVFTFGYGFGMEGRLGKMFSINSEFTAQQLYLGSWDYANILSKAKFNLNIKFGKYFSIFGGPVFNVYYSKQDIFYPKYKYSIPGSGYHVYDLGTDVKGWLGWNAGINFF